MRFLKHKLVAVAMMLTGIAAIWAVALPAVSLLPLCDLSLETCGGPRACTTPEACRLEALLFAGSVGFAAALLFALGARLWRAASTRQRSEPGLRRSS